ncbi:hypothetical protein FRB98_006154 [Tulasnella sp. 332]|nr:hypothetical protein FRB98_006154 [Tulasnella sp. 332]
MDPTDFDLVTSHLEEESRTREHLREAINVYEKKVRAMIGVLNKIHSDPNPNLLITVRPLLQNTHVDLAAFAALVKPNEVKDMWARPLQQAVFVSALCEWLTSGTLITMTETSIQLGIQKDWADRLVLATEDYLHGVITLINELSRLAVNSVTMGVYDMPSKISLFVKDLHAGFSMLNLKNDSLRRRFDSIKYDVKRIEEVVYDISLRQLGRSSNEEATPTHANLDGEGAPNLAPAI